MVSIPNSVRVRLNLIFPVLHVTPNLWPQSAEVGTEVTQQPPAVLPTALKKYDSLEEAIKTGLKTVSVGYRFMSRVPTSIFTGTGESACCIF